MTEREALLDIAMRKIADHEHQCGYDECCADELIEIAKAALEATAPVDPRAEHHRRATELIRASRR